MRAVLAQYAKESVTKVLPTAPQTYRRLRRTHRRLRRSVYGTLVGVSPVVADRLGLRQRAFERAYSTGVWTKTGESLSGSGSSLQATEQLREALPGLLVDLDVRRLLDVPCGDWNWMSRLPLDLDRYTGGDLVPSVVQANQARYADDRREFRVVDLCTDSLPAADLLLCRDALIHFSNQDVWRALDNVLASDVHYLATTTFPATQHNVDQVTGMPWRHLNLQAAPFHLPPPLRSLTDCHNRADQVLSVWRVADLRAWRAGV